MELQKISQFLTDACLISPEKSPPVEARHLAQSLPPTRKDLTKVKPDSPWLYLKTSTSSLAEQQQ